MDKEMFIKGIDEVVAGLKTIRNAVDITVDEEEEVVTAGFMSEPVEEEKPNKKAKKKTPVKEQETKEPVEVDGDIAEKLNGMKYNDLKKYASDLGIDAKGTRDKLVERILANAGDSPVEEKEEEPKKTSGKNSTKSDEFDKQAEEIIEETDIEDIIEALEEVGVEATEDNVKERLAYALREELLALGEEDDEEETEASDNDEETVDGTTYFEEYDDGTNEPLEMSEKRRKACEKLQQEKIDALENDKLSLDDIIQFLSENVTDDEAEHIDTEDEEQLIGTYMELIKRFVDEDGEFHVPEEHYEIGEENYCCGHKLNYIEDTDKYVCEVCGAEYREE